MKLLFLNPTADVQDGQLTGNNWLLPADTDTDALRQQIEAAIDARTALSVKVEVPGSGGVVALLTVNAAALLSVVIVEIPPKSPEVAEA